MKLKPIKQSFEVSYSYGLFFTSELFDLSNKLLKEVVSQNAEEGPHKILFVVDEGVIKAHPTLHADISAYCDKNKKVLDFRGLLTLPGGEVSKNDSQYKELILQAVDRFNICRHSYIAVIGGGAVVDAVGYAAAIAHRGVRLIRIPTTVLSQNDAAVGVKNGVNILGKKNFIGTFEPPFAVINDIHFLSTLEDRDWIAGIAEAVKVALIKDKEFYSFVKDNATKLRERDTDLMTHLIYRCAELHMEHIAQGGDPFERGSSRPLDFGHWSAHKLENMTNFKIRHGEAVAKGMALDLLYAADIGLISTKLADEIIDVLKEIGFDLSIPVKNKLEVEELLKGIEEFREHLGGELTITLIEGVGKKKDVHQIDLEIMRKAITTLNSKAKLNLA